jgi:site-specific recombinase XerD
VGRNSAGGCQALLLGFRLHLEAQRLSASVRRHYLATCARFLAWLGERPIASVRPHDLAAFLAEAYPGRSAKTVREHMLALRRFCRWLLSEGELRRDPTQGLRLPSFRTPPMPAYTPAEVRRLLMACDRRTLLGVRDYALVLVLFDTGVRAGELCSMTCQGLDWERGAARVVGKTGPREVPLGRSAQEALLRYLRRWGIESGPVWRGERGSLSEGGVLQAIRRLCRRAGVEAKGVHAFRRAAAIEMKRSGMNDSDILEVLGWRSIAMLRRYTAQEARSLAFQAHRRHSPADRLR